MSFRHMQIFNRKMQRRQDRALSNFLDFEAFGFEVYAQIDDTGFPYRGFIITPGGALKFGAGAATTITKRDFKRRVKASGLRRISFETLIESWFRGGLWKHRWFERLLVEEWLPHSA